MQDLTDRQWRLIHTDVEIIPRPSPFTHLQGHLFTRKQLMRDLGDWSAPVYARVRRLPGVGLTNSNTTNSFYFLILVMSAFPQLSKFMFIYLFFLKLI